LPEARPGELVVVFQPFKQFVQHAFIIKENKNENENEKSYYQRSTFISIISLFLLSTVFRFAKAVETAGLPNLAPLLPAFPFREIAAIPLMPQKKLSV
jgi:hypothetical protein